jgi:hypothetical protein
MNSRLRFVLFSPSIISDIGNPQATSVRALAQALVDLGHDVEHHEPKGNDHLTRMLTSRGYGPMRAFNLAFPNLRYSQYAPSGGTARRVWFSRVIGTADVVLAFPGTDSAVFDEIAELDSDRIVTIWPGSKMLPDDLRAKIDGPMVRPVAGSGERRDHLTVSYDLPINRVAGTHLEAGQWTTGVATFVPEVDIPARYTSIESVRIRTEEIAGLGLARALLPVASGSETILVNKSGAEVDRLTTLPDANNALLIARDLASYVDRELALRYVMPN